MLVQKYRLRFFTGLFVGGSDFHNIRCFAHGRQLRKSKKSIEKGRGETKKILANQNARKKVLEAKTEEENFC